MAETDTPALDGTLVCARCGCVIHPKCQAVHERYHEAVDALIDTSVMDELLKAERLESGE